MAGLNAIRTPRPGDGIRSALNADGLSAMLEVARAHRSGEFTAGGPPPAPGIDRATVLIRNDTGDGLPIASVVGLDAPIWEPTTAETTRTFQEFVAFKGVTPAAADHREAFAILLEPCGASEGAEAIVSGAVAVKIDVVHASHQYAEITDGQTGYLTSALSGPARILWRETGTGLKWAVVLMGAGPARTENLFAVRCWQDGGTTDGDGTTQCDRTYTVRTLEATAIDTGGELLGEDMTPKTRQATSYVGKMHCPPATGSGWVGLGYWQAGDFMLFDSGEREYTGPCE